MTISATAISDPSTPAGREQVGAIEYPTRRDEAWRYAPHDVLSRLSFGPPSAPAGILPGAVDGRIPVLDGPRIVIVNGVVDGAGSDLSDLPDGLRLSTLADDLYDPAELVAAHFKPDVEGVADAFVALNNTFSVNGAFVDVAEGHQVESPIHLVDVVIPDETQNASCTGAMIHIGEGSSATIVETRIGAGEAFGGLNVYPGEVEAALIAHPGVREVAVTGVPSSRWGEEVKAVVVAEPGVDVSASDLIAFCGERIAGYKRPRSVDFVVELPRNASGKVLKRAIREQYAE